MSSIDVAGAVRNILSGDSSINSELSTAIVSLAFAVNQLKNQQNQLKEQHDAATKELELVRRMSRTNWLLVINLPLPFGVSGGQALQLLFDNLCYAKPLFDAERDLLTADILYVNRNGAFCNMAFFVAQRHYDYIMGLNSRKDWSPAIKRFLEAYLHYIEPRTLVTFTLSSIIEHNLHLEEGIEVVWGEAPDFMT